MLRLLDAEAAGETVEEKNTGLLREAKAMTRHGYRDMLRLASASPG